MLGIISFLRHHLKSIMIFSFGIVFAVLLFTTPWLTAIEGMFRSFGYPGMLIVGVLYSASFTSATATILLTQTDPGLDPILASIIGGIGAVLYDTFFFLVARNEAQHGWLAAAIERLRARRQVPNWVSLALGGAILASPLPDELAAGLLGAVNQRLLPFLLLSFACNTLGIALVSQL